MICIYTCLHLFNGETLGRQVFNFPASLGAMFQAWTTWRR